MTQTKKGLIGHEDSEQGERDGKSDPGPKFDWNHCLALVRARQPGPADPAIEARIEVPAARTREVQQSISSQFLRHFQAGLAVTAFERSAEAGAYLLSQWPSE